MADKPSEGDYSLPLDYPLPGDSSASDQKNSQEPLLSQKEIPDPSDSVILYQTINDLLHDESGLQEEPNPDHLHMEVDMYSFKFQPKLFFKSLFISILYVSGLLMPFLCCVKLCASKFFKNYHYYSDSFALKFLGVCSTIYLVQLILLIIGDINNIMMIGYITRFQVLIVFSLTSAAIGAFCNRNLVDILNSEKLDSQSLTGTRFEVEVLSRAFPRRKRGKEVIKDEQESAIQQTISRLDIDISLYYLSFFAKTPKKLLRKVVRKEDFTSILEERENKIYYNKPVLKSDLLKGITNFERLLFEYKYFTEPNKFDNEKVHAYPLALEILTNIKKTSAASVLIGIFYCSIIGTYIYSAVFNFLGMVTDLTTLFVGLTTILSSSCYFLFPYLIFGFLTLQAFRMMSSKFSYMEELKELISTKRRRFDDGQQKAYPTMNILDWRSLKTWACLRKIFMRLDDEKLRGKILALTGMMVIELITLTVILLFYFKILGSPSVDYSAHLILYGIKSMLSLLAMFVLMYYAAKVNKQFEIHRNMIRENKQIAVFLFTQYPDLVGENAIVPGTYIYREGLKYLKKEFGENITPEIKANIKEQLEVLSKTYDSVLEELETEEVQNPIRILGLPITSTVVKGFGTVLVSLSTPILKEGFHYLEKLTHAS